MSELLLRARGRIAEVGLVLACVLAMLACGTALVAARLDAYGLWLFAAAAVGVLLAAFGALGSRLHTQAFELVSLVTSRRRRRLTAALLPIGAAAGRSATRKLRRETQWKRMRRLDPPPALRALRDEAFDAMHALTQPPAEGSPESVVAGRVRMRQRLAAIASTSAAIGGAADVESTYARELAATIARFLAGYDGLAVAYRDRVLVAVARIEALRLPPAGERALVRALLDTAEVNIEMCDRIAHGDSDGATELAARLVAQRAQTRALLAKLRGPALRQAATADISLMGTASND